MNNIFKIRKFYQLKHVERSGPVGERKESPAEHSWSSLILADYLLGTLQKKLDRLKVYELLLYHDVVEIETGDVPIHHEERRRNKEQEEKAAVHVLKEHIPKELGEKFQALFEEFEAQQTPEALFARAVDALDALIHFLDYKEYWKGWDEARVRKYHGEKIAKFPELQEVFENILAYAKSEGYFDQ